MELYTLLDYNPPIGSTVYPGNFTSLITDLDAALNENIVNAVNTYNTNTSSTAANLEDVINDISGGGGNLPWNQVLPYDSSAEQNETGITLSILIYKELDNTTITDVSTVQGRLEYWESEVRDIYNGGLELNSLAYDKIYVEDTNAIGHEKFLKLVDDGVGDYILKWVDNVGLITPEDTPNLGGIPVWKEDPENLGFGTADEVIDTDITITKGTGVDDASIKPHVLTGQSVEIVEISSGNLILTTSNVGDYRGRVLVFSSSASQYIQLPAPGADVLHGFQATLVKRGATGTLSVRDNTGSGTEIIHKGPAYSETGGSESPALDGENAAASLIRLDSSTWGVFGDLVISY